MSAKDDGGPAFPSKMLVNRFATEKTAQQLIGADGMSLRDYFAAKFIQRCDPCSFDIRNRHEVARYAYMMADAMITLRTLQSWTKNSED